MKNKPKVRANEILQINDIASIQGIIKFQINLCTIIVIYYHDIYNNVNFNKVKPALSTLLLPLIAFVVLPWVSKVT